MKTRSTTTRNRFSLSGLGEKARTVRAEQAEIKKKLADITAGISSAEREMRTALQTGDAEQYAEQKARRDKLETALSDLHKDATAPKVYEVREAAYNAWNDYAGGYNRAFSAKYDAYKVARKKLCEDYMELVEMQRGALNDRKEFETFLNENALVSPAIQCAELAMLENENAPEIDFLDRADLPGHRYGMTFVVKGRSAVPDADMDDQNVDPRFKLFMLYGCNVPRLK